MRKAGFGFVLACCLAVMLTGCAGMGGKSGSAPVIERSKGQDESSPKPATAKEKSTTGKSAPDASKKGGYYLDDGPGENPPPDIDAVPDAVVKNEPVRSATSRPYVALGETYTPMTGFQPYKEQGVASWYGRRYHGQKTSSGELYDMYGMSAAHTVLPIPSYVRVTNPENGRSVIVRVNDRGPFKKDRLIDLSYAAAYKLRLTGKGSGLVEVELLDPNAPVTPVIAKAENPPEPGTGVFVQLGAFRQKENADQLREKLQNQGLAQGVAIESWYNADLYRVRLGPYTNRDDAQKAADNIKQTLGTSAIITNP